MYTFQVEFSQRRKLALVIGNSEYEKADKLSNTVNDAQDMSNMLERIGFIIHEPKLNLTHKKMDDALNNFKHLIQSGDMVLFYFFWTWSTIRCMY